MPWESGRARVCLNCARLRESPQLLSPLSLFHSFLSIPIHWSIHHMPAATTPRPASPTRTRVATAASATVAAVAAAPAAKAVSVPPVAAAIKEAAAAATPPPPPAATSPLDRDGLQACVADFVAHRVANGKGKQRLRYDSATASSWAVTLAGELREVVRGFLGCPAASRYRVIALVSVTQRVGQGLARSAGCLWAAGRKSEGEGVGQPGRAVNNNTDACGWAMVENDEVGVVAEAFALYVH